MNDNDNAEPRKRGGSTETGYRAEDGPAGANGCTGGTDTKPCNGFTIFDTNRCWNHTHPMRRHQIKKEKAAREVVVMLEDSVFNSEYKNTTALEGLLTEMYRTLTIIRWLGDQLDEMARTNPEELTEHVSVEIIDAVSPTTDRSKSIETQVLRRTQTITPGMNPTVLWFLREREHFVRICNLALNVGIKLDKAELSQRQGKMMYNAMERFATSVGLDPREKQVAVAMLDAFDKAEASGGEPATASGPIVTPAPPPQRHMFRDQQTDDHS